MPVAKTVTGKPFEYSGSLATGLTVFFKPPHKKNIPVGIINSIRQEITKRSPVPENCAGEFGYVVTGAAFRKQGLANALSRALLKSFGGTLYATTRDDNPGIHKICRENAFQHVGEKWRSVEHPNSSLMLWLKR